MRMLIPGLMAVLLAADGAAMAEQSDDLALCLGSDIEACSRYIQGGAQPSRERAYEARGRVYQAKGEYDRAIGDFTEVIRIKKSADHFALRGAAYEKKGDYDRAIADFNEAIRLDKGNPAAYFDHRAHAYRLKGDLERAIADYSETISLTGRSDAYFDRGIAYSLKGAVDRAIADYDMAIVKQSDSIVTILLFHPDKADLQRVIADYGKLIARQPGNARAFHGRGWVHLRLYEPDLAVSDFSTAIRIDPKFTPAYTDRGDAYRMKGDVGRAMADYDAALSTPPDRCLGRVFSVARAYGAGRPSEVGFPGAAAIVPG